MCEKIFIVSLHSSVIKCNNTSTPISFLATAMHSAVLFEYLES